MENLSSYTIFDKPVPYKKLKIYPAIVKDYNEFNLYSICLAIEKNSIPIPEIISMTELEFIYYTSSLSEDSQMFFPYLIFFDRLLNLLLRKEDFENEEEGFEDIAKSLLRYKYDDKGKPIFIIDDMSYNSADFEKIKEIVVEQNLIELPDENISKEVRDSLEAARKYKMKLQREEPASFEDYVISLAVVTGWSLEYIYNMTIRKFTKSIQRYDNLLHYNIFLSASMSGMVEFKDKSFIKHWLTNLDKKDKYADVSVDYDALQRKISFEDAKK